ncbi:phage tail protein [Enterovibrio calviensis]|uniref:phage tail protein n=1 Tax=Enterovibrio calviensis TaxID=91359 RepID=UPI003736AD69
MKKRFNQLIKASSFMGLILFSTSSYSCQEDNYLGAVCYTAANYCPKNYVEANGQIMAISDFQSLFSLVGSMYGGNGLTTFGLPDLRGRIAVGAGQGIGLTNRVQGTQYGKESIQLAQQHIPSHEHVVEGSYELPAASEKLLIAANTIGGSTLPTDDIYLAKPIFSRDIYASDGAQKTTENLSVQVPAIPAILSGVTVSENSEPLPLMQPYTTIRACIAIKGIYPVRS